jgi:hypothetical protein
MIKIEDDDDIPTIEKRKNFKVKEEEGVVVVSKPL